MSRKKVLVFIFLLIFFFSGFASLLYQVAWERLLTVYYGVGFYSVTLIVSVYMLGLGYGALIGGRIIERIKNKILFYFFIEAGIGIFGLISPVFLNFLGIATAGSNYLVSFLCIFTFLALPTFLMGMTLPVLIKIYNGIIHSFFKTVSILYFINTLGAASGAVFASYYVISRYGIDTAIYFAVAVNFVLGAFIFSLRHQVSESTGEVIAQPPGARLQESIGRNIFIFVFITGFLAIGYEIIWFRVIGVLVKDSPYAFSSVLCIYLLGIALGSRFSEVVIHKFRNLSVKNLFFNLQFFIGLYTLFFFICVCELDHFPGLKKFVELSFSAAIHPGLKPVHSFKDFFLATDIFIWPFLLFFIPTLLMGATFPVVSMLSLDDPKKEARAVGTIYFFNVLGNVFGGLAVGFILLPFLKTQFTLLIFSIVGLAFMLFSGNLSKRLKIGIAGGSIGLIVLYLSVCGRLYMVLHIHPSASTVKYFLEGKEGVVMAYKKGEEVNNYINGSGHGRRPGYLFYYETMEALSYSNDPKSIFVVGFGAGSTVEVAEKCSRTSNIKMVEINETLVNNLKRIPEIDSILSHPKLQTIIEDGRRYLYKTDEKFDLVMIDPLRTRTSYSNNVYSTEFFSLIKSHLKENGIFLIWTDNSEVVPNTVASVFPKIRLYKVGATYFMLASGSDIVYHPEIKADILRSFSDSSVKNILALDSSYVGDRNYILENLAHYPVNTDMRPVAEYYLGMKSRYLEN